MALPAAQLDLVAAIRRGLREQAEPAKAGPMQAYMKSAMPYLGVRVPQVRSLTRTLVKSHPIDSTDGLRDTVLSLWREAEFREERYAATELTNTPTTRTLRAPDQIELYAELITTGAWWDHVDEVSHRVGDLLLAFPAAIRSVVEAWQTVDDHWLRRSSIICQIGAKQQTDRDLLTTAIEASAAEWDFFLRKAIGWALRDYARTDPDWVRSFVAGHELSPLSVREAMKHLTPIT